jgi:hypothetical protein
LLAVVLAVAGCGGHGQPRVAGRYLVYGRGVEISEPAIVLARLDGSGPRTRDGRVALAFGGRPTGGTTGGPLPPEWIAALPLGGRGRGRVLARGDVCCPSLNR